MKILYKTPLLKANTSIGKAKFWQGFVGILNSEEIPTIVTYSEYWTQGCKHQTSELTKVYGKNLGKTNETTPYDQAVSDITGDFNKKCKPGKGYEVTVPGDETPLQPKTGRITCQLAKGLKDLSQKKKDSLQYIGLFQPKLDGFRLLFNSDLGFWTREGNDLIPEVVNHLRFDTGKFIVDGEIMLPEAAFEETATRVKKFRGKELTEELELNLFDLYDPENPNLGQWDRIKLLEGLLVGLVLDQKLPKQVKFVKTTRINGKNEFDICYEHSLASGYEGGMFRDLDSPYKQGPSKTDCIIKHKEFLDDEFKILEVVEGKGKCAGLGQFVCELPEDPLYPNRPGSFSVKPRGGVEKQRNVWNNPEQWIGKMITVRFQALSAYGVPRFGRALLAIRSEVE